MVLMSIQDDIGINLGAFLPTLHGPSGCPLKDRKTPIVDVAIHPCSSIFYVGLSENRLNP